MEIKGREPKKIVAEVERQSPARGAARGEIAALHQVVSKREGDGPAGVGLPDSDRAAA